MCEARRAPPLCQPARRLLQALAPPTHTARRARPARAAPSSSEQLTAPPGAGVVVVSRESAGQQDARTHRRRSSGAREEQEVDARYCTPDAPDTRRPVPRSGIYPAPGGRSSRQHSLPNATLPEGTTPGTSLVTISELPVTQHSFTPTLFIKTTPFILRSSREYAQEQYITVHYLPIVLVLKVWKYYLKIDKDLREYYLHLRRYLLSTYTLGATSNNPTVDPAIGTDILTTRT